MSFQSVIRNRIADHSEFDFLLFYQLAGLRRNSQKIAALFQSFYLKMEAAAMLACGSEAVF